VLLAGGVGKAADRLGDLAVEYGVVLQEQWSHPGGRGLDVGLPWHLPLHRVAEGAVDDGSDEPDGGTHGGQVLATGDLAAEHTLGAVAELIERVPPSADLAGRARHAAHFARQR